jgi:hypothetical protein
MREKLQQYVELLFAGVPGSEEVKEEILLNTLDRYDDLISQGKVPEAAYRLAIAGIGDINEILGTERSEPKASPTCEVPPVPEDPARKKNRAAAIGLYIASPIPLFILSEQGYPTMGLCLTLLLVATATAVLLMNRSSGEEADPAPTPKRKDHPLMGLVTLAIYLLLSFLTGAWYITWLVFPIMGAVGGLLRAISDLKEAVEYEN